VALRPLVIFGDGTPRAPSTIMRNETTTLTTPITRLRDQLARELVQSEHDARVHTRREAKRLGNVPPARALAAIAAHADVVGGFLASYVGAQQPRGRRIGAAVGAAFSAVRQVLVDRVIDAERSYRATLLGLKHGIDTARLLRDVATAHGEVDLARWCDALVEDRGCLVEIAERALAWFAVHPDVALASGARLALRAG
jgi:hypothetical protein